MDKEVTGKLFDYQFRLIVVGDSTVGKSSLLRYFTDARFDDGSEPTIGADFYVRKMEIKSGIIIKLQLWDTAGQERFRSITRAYYRNSVGVLLVYDVTKHSSFDHLAEWLDEARSHIEPQLVAFMVIGHKADRQNIDRAVTTIEGKRFADAHGFRFFETSAVTGQNVERAFLTITEDIYELFDAGKFGLKDNWDGIKIGKSIPLVESFEREKSVEEKKCC